MELLWSIATNSYTAARGFLLGVSLDMIHLPLLITVFTGCLPA
jgi:hypothetical protein